MNEEEEKRERIFEKKGSIYLGRKEIEDIKTIKRKGEIIGDFLKRNILKNRSVLLKEIALKNKTGEHPIFMDLFRTLKSQENNSKKTVSNSITFLKKVKYVEKEKNLGWGDEEKEGENSGGYVITETGKLFLDWYTGYYHLIEDILDKTVIQSKNLYPFLLLVGLERKMGDYLTAADIKGFLKSPRNTIEPLRNALEKKKYIKIWEGYYKSPGRYKRHMLGKMMLTSKGMELYNCIEDLFKSKLVK
ncbi:MAG: hypothetical protein ABIF92_02190 [archaeon]